MCEDSQIWVSFCCLYTTNLANIAVAVGLEDAVAFGITHLTCRQVVEQMRLWNGMELCTIRFGFGLKRLMLNRQIEV